MNSTSRVGSSSSISVVSCLACGGMVCSFVAADPRGGRDSSLDVAVHEVDLLKPAQTLADVLRPYLPHSLDGLELGVGPSQQLIEATELAHDLVDHELRQPRDAPED